MNRFELTRLRSPAGFTLVEVLVAMACTLLLMTMVVNIFIQVNSGITSSRAVMDMADQLRLAKQRLQADLEGVTATGVPPLDPAEGKGYFEYVEGPMGALIQPAREARFNHDSTIGDLDDILMFTAISMEEPFVGRFGRSGNVVRTFQSETAEIAWFVRGFTLYRRVLLVRPQTTPHHSPALSYYDYDLSMRFEGGPYDRTLVSDDIGINYTQGPVPRGVAPHLRANSLSDLTKRENRFAHPPYAWPHDVRFWNTTNDGRPGLGLPILAETSASAWQFPRYMSVAGAPMANLAFDQSPLFPNDPFMVILRQTNWTPANLQLSEYGFPLYTNRNVLDPWRANASPQTYAFAQANATTGYIVGYTSPRRANEDVILSNVLSFDVKIWDPGAPLFHVNGDSPDNPNEPQTSQVLIPGDIGYIQTNNASSGGALTRFARNAHPAPGVKIAGFGAYVDLNYMGRASTATATGHAQYLTRLRDFENAIGVPLRTFPRPQFAGPGDPRSGLSGTPCFSGNSPRMRIRPYGETALQDLTGTHRWMASIYDTYSTHYEYDGINQTCAISSGYHPYTGAALVVPDWAFNTIDEGTDGVDNHLLLSTPVANTGIDEGDRISVHATNGLVTVATAAQDGLTAIISERETAPPYPFPMRGLQITIRVFEPDTKQIIQATVVKEFLPE